MPERLPLSRSRLQLKGQGVYTRWAIKKGELVECSPVIPVPPEQWPPVSRTVLRHCAYIWDEGGGIRAVALGWGSLFRGPVENPNTLFVPQPEKTAIQIFATRDIARGEEITVDHRRPGIASAPACVASLSHGAGELEQLFYLKNSPGKGRGVFVRRPIAEAELIERAALLIIPAGEWNQIAETVLSNYWFSCGPNREHAAIAMGYGSLFNHSYTPNAVYEVREGEWAVYFKTLREIEAGEEITINYNRDPQKGPPTIKPTETNMTNTPACSRLSL